jgi:hypothetical protein
MKHIPHSITMNIIELITPYNIFLSQLPLAKGPGGSMS